MRDRRKPTVAVVGAIALSLVACTSTRDTTVSVVSGSEADDARSSGVSTSTQPPPERGGQTTTDSAAAQQILDGVVAAFGPPEPFVMAALTVEPRTGQILAAAVSSGEPSEFIDMQRPSASTLKAILLVSALEAGLQPEDGLIVGLNCSFIDVGLDTRPDDASGVVTSLRQATEISSDCGFVKLARVLGPERIRQTLDRVGIQRQFDLGASFGVGANTVSMRELAQLFSTLLNGGKAVHASLSPEPSASSAGLDPAVAEAATDVLAGVLERGTAAGSELAGRWAAGKTGTSGGPTDVWFVGGTPTHVTVVWAGSVTDPAAVLSDPLGDGDGPVTGGSYAAKAWQAAMDALTSGTPVVARPESEGDRPARVIVDPTVDCRSATPSVDRIGDSMPALPTGRDLLDC